MKIAPLVILTSLCVVFLACSYHSNSEPIVVHVLRDPAAAEIGSALTTLGAMQLHTRRGQPIIIASIEPRDYSEGLEELGHQIHPELVIFNSSEDVEKAKVGVSRQGPLRLSSKLLYPVIPNWVSGEERTAAELVLAELRHELQNGKTVGSGASR